MDAPPPEGQTRVSVDAYQLAGPYATVFDVGADTGKFAIACLEEWSACEVHSFEPLRGIASQLPARWHWHRVALGAVPGTVTMNRNQFLPSSSILTMTDLHRHAFPYTAESEPVDVEIRTLEDFDLAVCLFERSLLKLDVQGYELEVLKGAGKQLGLFDAVLVETNHVELYLGAPTPKELAAYLCQHGFAWQATLDVLRHPQTGELLQTDELWTHR